MVLALAHCCLNPGMTDYRRRASSFLLHPHAAHTLHSSAGEWILRIFPLSNNIIHMHPNFLGKRVQVWVCVSTEVTFLWPCRKKVASDLSWGSYQPADVWPSSGLVKKTPYLRQSWWSVAVVVGLGTLLLILQWSCPCNRAQAFLEGRCSDSSLSSKIQILWTRNPIYELTKERIFPSLLLDYEEAGDQQLNAVLEMCNAKQGSFRKKIWKKMYLFLSQKVSTTITFCY